MNFDRELLGNALPAYDIGEELGQGGMGLVVSGQHRQLGRRVAIKQLPSAFAADPEVRRRFAAEARVLASLDHPHVVPVYDYVEYEGVCLLVMALLSGGTLRGRVAESGGLTAPQSVAVSLACLSGLAAAHRRGVLHRDVKPENILFAETGILKVADFGIAKVLGGADTVMTRRGEVIGTPSYIAPEQVLGNQLSPATDVYAVATMLYELLADCLPFSDDGGAVTVMFKHAYDEPIPLRNVEPDVPGALAAVVMRGLATDPAGRFATAESFGAALAEAGTQTWGPGWLSAQQVPIMDAGPVIGAAGLAATPRPGSESGLPTGTGSSAGPGLPGGPTSQATSAVAPQSAAASLNPLTQSATLPGREAAAGETLAPSSASPATSAIAGIASASAGLVASQETTMSPEAAGAEPSGTRPGRRRTAIIAAVIAAVIVIAVVIILLLHAKIFSSYSS
jgi:hypothetical protein